METKYRLSRCAVISRSIDGKWVWDDYVNHHKYVLSTLTLQLLDLVDGKTLQQVMNSLPPDFEDSRAASVLKGSIERGILVPTEGDAHQHEERILDGWVEYGMTAAAYHFASRGREDTPFTTVPADTDRLVAKAVDNPPPPPFFEVPDGTYRPLPAGNGIESLDKSLGDALRDRRTIRQFTGADMSLDALSTLLHICCGPTVRPGQEETVLKPLNSYFKVVPSGGARHPTEWFLNVLGVSDLEPGAYHYHAGNHAVCRLGPPLEGDMLGYAAGNQPWVADGSVQILFAAHTERSRWKYDMARTYRAINLDVGHISQTVFLVANALGLGAAFIGSFRDECWERRFRLNPVDQLVLGLMILGPEGSREGKNDNA